MQKTKKGCVAFGLFWVWQWLTAARQGNENIHRMNWINEVPRCMPSTCTAAVDRRRFPHQPLLLHPDAIFIYERAFKRNQPGIVFTQKGTLIRLQDQISVEDMQTTKADGPMHASTWKSNLIILWTQSKQRFHRNKLFCSDIHLK